MRFLEVTDLVRTKPRSGPKLSLSGWPHHFFSIFASVLCLSLVNPINLPFEISNDSAPCDMGRDLRTARSHGGLEAGHVLGLLQSPPQCDIEVRDMANCRFLRSRSSTMNEVLHELGSA